MSKQLPITVVTYNGEFLETPKLMYFDCDKVVYVGMYISRTYDINDCIVARMAFGFLYGNDLWQTFDFKNLEQFITFRDSYCLDACCSVLVNGCYILFNGQKIGYGAM